MNDYNLNNVSVKIDLTQFCQAKTYGIFNLKENKDAIEYASFAKLIKYQWEEKKPYLFSLAQDSEGINLYPFDAGSVLKIVKNPLTNSEITNVFFFTIKLHSPSNEPRLNYLGYSNFKGLESPAFGTCFPKGHVFPLGELITSEEIAVPQELKPTQLEFHVTCFAPLKTSISIDLEEIEFCGNVKFLDLINTYKGHGLPFVLAIVQDKIGMTLSYFSALSLDPKGVNPKTNAEINKIFYYLISGDNNSIDYLGQFEPKDGPLLPIIDLHLKAMGGSPESLVEMADYYKKMKKFETAFLWYASASQKKCSTAIFQLALAYMKGEGVLKNLEVAEQKFASIQKNSTEYNNAQFLLGLCQFELDFFEKAAKTLKTLLSTCKNYEDTSKASFHLGLCNFRLEKYDEAKKSFESIKKESEDYADSQWHLGLCLLRNSPNRTQRNSAAACFKSAAHLNHAGAQYHLGMCFKTGTGIPKNLKKAFEMYVKAANLGCPDALFEIALIYQAGTIVAKDPKIAFEYFKTASEHGLADAQYQTGLCYQQGVAVSQDINEAIRYYRMAADKGHVEASFKLAVCCKIGLGCSKDLKEAVHYFKLAADKGKVEAQYSLGLCYLEGYGTSQDYKLAVHYFKLAADQGQVQGQNYLGHCYLKGKGVAENLKEAVRYLEMAAKQGLSASQFSIAMCYFKGKGVPKDVLQGMIYLKMAAAQGHREAADLLLSMDHK